MRKIKHYPDEGKLSLLEEFRASGVSMNQFQKFHGLGHCTISKWMINLDFQTKNQIQSS